MTTPCRNTIKLYGGLRKNQRQNYQPIPPGTRGVITVHNAFDPEINMLFCMAKFVVDGKVVYVRCAPGALEVET